MKRLTLQVTIDPETGDLHTLDRCPGFHPDIQKTCSPRSLACLDGAVHDMDDHSGGTNALLAHVELLVGSHQVMGLSGFMGLSGSMHRRGEPGSSVRLYVNDRLFRLEGDGDTRPVWAVIVKDRAEESLYVTVYITLEDALVAYRREVAGIYGGTECSMDLMDHGLGEPCECGQAGVTPAQLDLRALLPRSEHCLVSTYPEALCMCGTRLRPLGLDDHPALGEHLDAVITEAPAPCPQAAPKSAAGAVGGAGSDVAGDANAGNRLGCCVGGRRGGTRASDGGGLDQTSRPGQVRSHTPPA